MTGDTIKAAEELLQSLAPGGQPFPIRVSLVEDECAWFEWAVEGGLLTFAKNLIGASRQWKADAPRDIAVAGPDLAAAGIQGRTG